MNHLRTSDMVISAALGELIFLSLVPVQLSLDFFHKLHLDKIPVPLFFWWFALILPVLTVLGYWILFLLSKKFPVMIQVARYGLIGVFNTILNLAIINILILWSGIASGYVADVFAVISFVIVVTNSFFWNKYWTFAPSLKNGTMPGVSKNEVDVFRVQTVTEENVDLSGRQENAVPFSSAGFAGGQAQKTTAEYIQFFAVSISGALLNLGIFHTIVNIIGPRGGIDPKAWANVALAIGIPVSFIWNFFGYRLFVFRSDGTGVQQKQ